MKSLKRLLKDYELTQRYEYFDLVFNSLVNGNISQARELFQSMKREDRKDCYRYYIGFYDIPNGQQNSQLNFFLNLI